MPANPPEGTQRIIPYILYKDAAAAIEFLCTAFGFEERFRIDGPDGTIGHAEVGYQDNVLMLATAMEEMGMKAPQDLPAIHSMILCYVDDCDAHYAHAKEAGATIVAEPEDQPYGDRAYRAIDPQGHCWSFHTHTKDVAIDEVTQHYANR